MILVRSPLRITLGGGGTDLPPFVHERGGFCLTAAIDKYVYVSAIRPFEPGIYLKYSELERVSSWEQVQHPIIREALAMLDVEERIELTALADVPAGTGLGSSSSFTTALLEALMLYEGHANHSPEHLARLACDLEIGRLKEPIGRQDQYASAFGGLLALTFGADETVRAEALPLAAGVACDLQDRLLLFFTGYARPASATLREQSGHLDEIKALGLSAYRALCADDLPEFGRLLDEHWRLKQRRGAVSNDRIDGWYRLAKANGALGGKLVGAGGGGFLLFFAEDPQRLRRALRGSGLQELRFRFDVEGTKVLLS